MRKLEYHLVDVFTDRQFGGNQLAVLPDGRNIPTELMEKITRELNLSETTFVLPPEDTRNDFKVRIFTPGKELPMAGHPTVGTAFVLARLGKIEPTDGQAQTVFEEGVGPIPVALEWQGDAPGMITMTQPLPQFGTVVEDTHMLEKMLSLPMHGVRRDIPAQVVSCGVPFLFVPLQRLEDARRARVRMDVYEPLMDNLGVTEVFVFSQEVENEGSTVHSRMFAPGIGITEDPATGGASGPLGSYFVRYGLVDRSSSTIKIVSEQGIEMGRPSFIHIEIGHDDGQITSVKVGGQCVYVGRGELEIAE